ncbi:guanine deaminase [Aestuariivirga sp. YIM B02566]|uniref:Guanine deaminase n=1 Tax=Taklimakanibacter albus TaxID=2800327 RepID=A0ACC5R366_9HYPH|nr:guanine deaminase [Aestuariivirga sp. YIM B02566]MBK1867101.1 guanine deaminase [Aestuariivirga sp. YIM B02566]
MKAPFSICGTAFHAPKRGELEILSDALIEVGADGGIDQILKPDHPHYDERKSAARASGMLRLLGDGEYLLPGFVDLHIHAPQFPQLGKALDAPLEDWLQKYTFPLEARYSDRAFASSVYDSLVGTLLANGTTTAVYFATRHLDGSLVLAETCLAKGQRAVIGRVAMDDIHQCPDYYRDASPDEGIELSRQFIQRLRALPGNGKALVRPAVTPRFIPSCSDRLLSGLGELLEAEACHMQTHCSESDWAHAYVLERFGKSDTEMLAEFGLLTRQSILAHANLMGTSDFDLVQAKGSGVAHCPLSNFYFANAVFPLRRLLDQGLHLGLGTDISGGHSPSILDNCRHAMTAARALHDGVDARLPAARRGAAPARIMPSEAFWLATAGGGEALDLPIGLFREGMRFDALLVDVNAPQSNITRADNDGLPDIFQKILCNAGRPNITSVWVEGRCVS